MSYLVNQTIVSSLSIGGSDYTSSLVSWTASDQSAYNVGCIQTTGTLILGSYVGGPPVEDYNRDVFRRGTVVTLDLTEPGGVPYRHPRGYLYVVSTSYNVENAQLTLQLGCRLVMMALTDNVNSLLPLVPIPLDVARLTYENCSASFSAAGQYVFQDNQGSLRTGTFFGGDSRAGVEGGEWISILGVTAAFAAPLSATAAIPDIVRISYQVPEDDFVADPDGGATDQRGYVDTVETESYYFTRYPAVAYVRINSDADPLNPNGTLGNIDSVDTSEGETSGGESSCGNTPDPPTGPPVESCNEGYELQSSPLYLPALSKELNTTVYDAPAAQVSYIYSERKGPSIESNSQYYADKFAYCRSTYATACQPNGECPFDGMEETLLGYDETFYEYGQANEVTRVIVDNYETVLSAAQPSDWRSGNVNGVPQDFDGTLTPEALYRSRREETLYYQEGNANVEEVITFTSLSSRGVGIRGELDALLGVETRVVKRSSTTSSVVDAPDRLNTSTISTKDASLEIVLFTDRYKTPPEETGPYLAEVQVPVPLLFDDADSSNTVLESYSNYVERFIKGDALGLQIGEGMREDVVSNWRPGMPFRYYDISKNRVVAMRMNATVWGVSLDQSAFVTSGVWIGTSNGTVTIPSNLIGNSLPDMGSGAQPPEPVVPPSIDNETNVDGGSFAWTIDVHLALSVDAMTFGSNGIVPILPSSTTRDVYCTTICFVSGAIVGPGDLLTTGTDGSIPVENAGSLISVGATVVDADLFS